MENINGNELNLEQMISKIKLKNPVRVVNFDLENKFGVVGMAIACKIDDLSVIKPDKKDITDDSFLFFNQTHISETIQIIHAMLTMLASSGMITQSHADTIVEYLISRCCVSCKYKIFSKKIDDIAKLYLGSTNMVAHMMNNLLYIIKNIWFMPYDKIDAIYNETVEAYKNASESAGENNDSDNKTS